MQRDLRHLLSSFLVSAMVLAGFMLSSDMLFGQEKKAKPAVGSTPAEVYAAKLSDWKALLKEMRSLKAEVAQADEAQAEEIRGRW